MKSRKRTVKLNWDPAGPGLGVKHVRAIMAYPPPAACIKWPMFVSPYNGYGQVQWKGKCRRVHRLICELTYGPPSSEKMVAAHSCGNSWCVNPSHLRWATQSENQFDAKEHGTMLIGECKPNARLTENAVIDIRKNRGVVPLPELAKKYSVSVSTVFDAQSGKNWKHLPL